MIHRCAGKFALRNFYYSGAGLGLERAGQLKLMKAFDPICKLF